MSSRRSGPKEPIAAVQGAALDDLKRLAAERAADMVESGQVVGLGTGSTARYAVERIGSRIASGKLRDVVGVPTSEATATQARSLGIPVLGWRDGGQIDIAIDGADEVDSQLNLIKGLGGALLREKAVEERATRFIVVIDESKLSGRLGERVPLPVEVSRGQWREEARWLTSQGCTPTLRGGEAAPFVTDNGNVILDCRFERGIADPAALAEKLQTRAAIKAHGLFLAGTAAGADEVIVAGRDGVRTLGL